MEKKKKLLVYDPSIHDYSMDKPVWEEILPGHFVYGNQKELEQQLRRSGSFTQMMARSELDSGAKRPLLPLSISQIGLIGGSGMINGLIECDTPHIIKGRIIKVKRQETEETFSARGKHMGSEVRETISNKMIFNVLTPNGFKALT